MSFDKLLFVLILIVMIILSHQRDSGEGTNSAGNTYRSGQNRYHYSNQDGSYYYKNSDGSTYYKSADGNAYYNRPEEDN